MKIYIIVAQFRNGQKKIAGYSSSEQEANKSISKAKMEMSEGKRFDACDWRVINFTPNDITDFEVIPIQEIDGEIEIHWRDNYQDEDGNLQDFPLLTTKSK